MQREPAVDHSGFNRSGIFIGAAASGHELRIDLAYWRAPLVGFDTFASSSNFRSAASGAASGRSLLGI